MANGTTQLNRNEARIRGGYFLTAPKPFMRSQHKALVNKTPAEILTGKMHNSWLEMLGFSAWHNRKAA
jgi:hypothetical protein